MPELQPRRLRRLLAPWVAVLSVVTVGLTAVADTSTPTRPVVLTIGGAGTTEQALGVYLMFRPQSTYDGRTYQVDSVTLPASNELSAYAPGDPRCSAGDVVWGREGRPVPTSGAAAAALLRAERQGQMSTACLDAARSTEHLGDDLHHVAFALDVTAWATASSLAPRALSAAQVRDIYRCAATDWADVGGRTGPITRYLPPEGDDLRSRFLRTFGLSDADVRISGARCPTVVSTAADGSPLPADDGSALRPLDTQRAILPYTGSVWVQQAGNASNPTLDRRGGVQLGSIIHGTAVSSPVRWLSGGATFVLDTLGVVRESNVPLVNPDFDPASDFVGVHYHFNVLDPANAASFGPAAGLLSFRNESGGARSPLCSGQAALTLASFGLAPLTTDNPAGTNLASSTCRNWSPVGVTPLAPPAIPSPSPTPSVPPPSVMPPPGQSAPNRDVLSLGVFREANMRDQLVGVASFGALTGHDHEVLHTYIRSSDGGPDPAVVAWLQADPDRRVLLGVVPLAGLAGRFYDPTEDARNEAIARRIQAYGIADQVIYRFGFEMNGNWHDWGRQHPGNATGQGFRDMWNRIVPKLKAIAPGMTYAWCVVLHDGTIERNEWFYPGDQHVDYITGDLYDVDLARSADPDQRWQAKLEMANGLRWLADFAAARNKPWALDEWGLWNAHDGRGGGGDNPTFVTNVLSFASERGAAWVAYYDSSSGGVGTNLASNPRSLEAYRAAARLLVP